MRSNVHIRLATPQDAGALAELLIALDLFRALKDCAPAEVKVLVDAKLEACQNSPSHSVLVVDGEPNILGYAAVHWLPCLFQEGPDGYLSELFVRAEVRGQQIGSRLLDAVVVEAERRGCRRLTLINLRNRDSYTRDFYRKRGWTEQSEAARFVYHMGAA